VVVHGATDRQWTTATRAPGLDDPVRNAFADHGNVVSASIPAVLATAVPRSRAPRRVVAMGASAGMSFAVARFAVDPAVIADGHALDAPTDRAHVDGADGHVRVDAPDGRSGDASRSRAVDAPGVGVTDPVG
jgi:hypothetical protein